MSDFCFNGDYPFCVPLYDDTVQDKTQMITLTPSELNEFYWQAKQFELTSFDFNSATSIPPGNLGGGTTTGMGSLSTPSGPYDKASDNSFLSGTVRVNVATDQSQLVCFCPRVISIDPPAIAASNDVQPSPVGGSIQIGGGATWSEIYYDPNVSGGGVYYIVPAFNVGWGEGQWQVYGIDHSAFCTSIIAPADGGSWVNTFNCLDLSPDYEGVGHDFYVFEWDFKSTSIGTYTLSLLSGAERTCPIYGVTKFTTAHMGICDTSIPTGLMGADAPTIACNATISITSNW